MPTRLETFPIELRGGLVSNLSVLQQGIQMPGSARELINFEPSVKGGYRRISGYTKFDSNHVPLFGGSLVQGSGQSGTTLIVANLHESPSAGDSFTIAGVTGTYTIASGGVSYSSTNKSATLTLTSSLASSPADQAALTWTNSSSYKIEGLFYSIVLQETIAVRSGMVYTSSGTGWTRINTPDYGTVLVDGGSQTGASLVVDGIDDDDYVPQAGDTFTIAGIEKVYTVLTPPTVTSGSATISINPSLASSPADNAAITWLASTHTGASKCRFDQFNFNGVEKIAMVDGNNKPAIIDENSNYSTLQGTADIVGASHVVDFKDHLFFVINDLVVFTAPFNETDFNTANGAAVYRMPRDITGFIVFREQLFHFTEQEIKVLSGDSALSFELNTVSDDIGCIAPDTIKEVGGDILFLGPDGIRYLGATDKTGDFALALASRPIQQDVLNLISPSADYVAVLIREKNQYRLFRYSTDNALPASERGFIGAQFADQSGQGFYWSRTLGIKAYRTSSGYDGLNEYVIFSNNDGYVYRMESGSTFDGTAISASFYTPWIPVNDPSFKKRIHSVATYLDQEGSYNGVLNVRLDFAESHTIQPDSLSFSADSSGATYGEAIYGTDSYGSTSQYLNKLVAEGNFNVVSFEYLFNQEADDPFTLDTVIIEYRTKDRY